MEGFWKSFLTTETARSNSWNREKREINSQENLKANAAEVCMKKKTYVCHQRSDHARHAGYDNMFTFYFECSKTVNRAEYFGPTDVWKDGFSCHVEN